MALNRYNQLVRIQKLTIDPVTWTAIQKETGEPFTKVEFYNSVVVDVSIRSDVADANTEENLIGGMLYSIRVDDLRVRQSILPELPVVYVRSNSGVGPLIVRWFL